MPQYSKEPTAYKGHVYVPRLIEGGDIRKDGHHIAYAATLRDAIRIIDDLLSPRCESGWTGDRCTKPLGHEGEHSNP